MVILFTSQNEKSVSMQYTVQTYTVKLDYTSQEMINCTSWPVRNQSCTTHSINQSGSAGEASTIHQAWHSKFRMAWQWLNTFVSFFDNYFYWMGAHIQVEPPTVKVLSSPTSS